MSEGGGFTDRPQTHPDQERRRYRDPFGHVFGTEAPAALASDIDGRASGSTHHLTTRCMNDTSKLSATAAVRGSARKAGLSRRLGRGQIARPFPASAVPLVGLDPVAPPRLPFTPLPGRLLL